MDVSHWMTLIKTLGSLALVLVTIYALAWASKKYLRPERFGQATGGEIKVIQSFALGPKTKLMVVDVQSQRLVLGVGSETIQSLGTLPVPLEQKEGREAHSYVG